MQFSEFFNLILNWNLQNTARLIQRAIIVTFVLGCFFTSIVWLNEELLLLVSFSLLYYLGYNGLNIRRFNIYTGNLHNAVYEVIQNNKHAIVFNRDVITLDDTRRVLKRKKQFVRYNVLNLYYFVKKSLENLSSLLSVADISLQQQKKELFETYLNKVMAFESSYQSAILTKSLNSSNPQIDNSFFSFNLSESLNSSNKLSDFTYLVLFLSRK